MSSIKPYPLSLARTLYEVRYSPTEIALLTMLYGFPLPASQPGATAPRYELDKLEEWRASRELRLRSFLI